MTDKKLYRSLEEINKDELVLEIINNIMEEIKDHKIIYQNEEQFQFDLAWRINKRIDETSNIQVLLECFSMTDKKMDNKNSRKKFFTDIILSDEKGCFIPIELKYKKQGITTKVGKNKQKVVIGNDGAADLGKFDYLWDIHRIEQLKQKPKENIEIEDGRLKCFVCGYAIMITNDNSYWEIKEGSCADLMTLNRVIKEIRWQSVNGTQAKSIYTKEGKNYKKYFLSLIEDKANVSGCEIEKRYLPLLDYDFSPIGSNKNIITIDNYECESYRGKAKNITIKAFVAKIK